MLVVKSTVALKACANEVAGLKRVKTWLGVVMNDLEFGRIGKARVDLESATKCMVEQLASLCDLYGELCEGKGA